MPDVRKTLTDTGYIVIGLGVMGFQQAQVQRRALQQRVTVAGEQLSDAARDGKRRFEDLTGEVSQRVEPIREKVEHRLGEVPERVSKAMEPVHKTIHPVYERVRDLTNRAAS
jgi:hypothetical protein